MSPFNVLREHLKPGMIAVDIGANVGDLTHTMADAVGLTGLVYAIEPCAPTIDAARKHQEDRNLVAFGPNVTWLNYAVGKVSDEIRSLYHSDEPTRHTLYMKNVLSGDGAFDAVRVRSLDSLIETGELPCHVDFIKIDAQGAEDDILAGASIFLEAGKTIWVLEVWPEGLLGAEASVAGLISRLRSHGLQPIGFSDWDAVSGHAGGHRGHSAFDLLVVPS